MVQVLCKKFISLHIHFCSDCHYSKMKLLKFLILSFCLFQISEGLKTKPKQKPKVKVQSGGSKHKNATTKSRVKNSENLSIKVFQVSESGFTRFNQTEVAIPENGEIVVGKDTTPDKWGKLILHCSATYPVQWIYSGDGNPQISTNLTMSMSGSAKMQVQIYEANVGLGYNGGMNETDTGEYICQRVQMNKNWPNYLPQFASLYIYVPGNLLFIQTTGGILYPPKDANWIRIPCSITHPDVVVTVQKNDNGLLQCPSEHEVQFSPKSGFIVTSKTSLRGKYICIGSLNGDQSQMQLLEYSVLDMGNNDESLFHREASVYGKHQRSFNQHHNDGDYDHDNSESFEEYIYTRNEESPCYPTNPCGPNSVCKPTIGKSPLPRCSCRPTSVGRPPKCRPECAIELDCPLDMSCQGQRCVNPCIPNHCGQRAVCTVVNHVPKCSCPPGYVGNPERNGKCGKSRGPSIQYFPQPPDTTSESEFVSSPFLEFGSIESSESLVPESFQNQNQNRYPCDPWPCGPNSECRPVGDDAHCTCSKGYVGIPPNCRSECVHSSHCQGHLSCIELKCRDPCVFTDKKCGFRAGCRTMDHQPFCFCPKGYYGDPTIKCRRQPQNQQHFPPDHNNFPDSPSSSMENGPFNPTSRPPLQQQRPHPTVGMNRPRPNPGVDGGHNYPIRPPPQEQYPTPTSPCINSPCGKNAICNFRNETVGCKCPHSLSGWGSDPYVECYPSNNPCESCGPYSKCVVNQGQSECSCLPGKVGSPPNCRDGFCQRNRDCDDDQHCHEGHCDNPCIRANCGKNSVCRGMRHHAICACRNAPDRDPLFGCPSHSRRDYEKYNHYEGDYVIQSA